MVMLINVHVKLIYKYN